jgi:hypothetical protein
MKDSSELRGKLRAQSADKPRGLLDVFIMIHYGCFCDRESAESAWEEDLKDRSNVTARLLDSLCTRWALINICFESHQLWSTVTCDAILLSRRLLSSSLFFCFFLVSGIDVYQAGSAILRTKSAHISIHTQPFGAFFFSFLYWHKQQDAEEEKEERQKRQFAFLSSAIA